MTRDASLRAEDRRPAALVVRTLLSCGALLVLGFAAYWAARLGWADHLSRSGDPADRERAVRLAPDVSTLYERLAEQREALGGDSLPDLKRAAALDPADAALRLRLGLRGEMAGDFPLAESSLLAAASLSRLYQPRYLLAQYYFRRQNADGFFRWTREAFEAAYGDVAPLFDLCWRLHPDAEWLARYALPARPEIARQFLSYLVVKNQSSGARALAERISETAEVEDLPALLDYTDARLAAGDGAPATAVWNALCRRALLPHRPLEPACGLSLTNADFHRAPSGRGFDWRMVQPPGIAASYPGTELRLAFSGRQAEMWHIAWQYLAVVPGARYRLRFRQRPIDAASADGVGWKIDQPSGIETVTEPFPDGSLVFTAPAEVLRLILLYRRPPGVAPIEGTVAVAGLRLEMER